MIALGLKIGTCSRAGFPPVNEDTIGVLEGGHFTACLVADGYRSWEEPVHGEIASQRAVAVISRELKRGLVPGMDIDRIGPMLRAAVRQAHAQLRALAQIEPHLERMGTTIVAAVWHSDTLHLASVGDSRCYGMRGNQITQLTVDDTLATELADAGHISREEAKTHRFNSVLCQSLGNQELGEKPDVSAWPVHPRDRYLLCTDGLTNNVAEPQLLLYLQTEIDVQRCAERLCQQALDNGSRDNVSCIVVEVVENPSPSTPVAVKMAKMSNATTSEGLMP